MLVILHIGFLSPFVSPAEQSARADVNSNRQDSTSVATFTLEVMDSNKTLAVNQTVRSVNSTEAISLSCDPVKIKLHQGELSTIVCDISNNSYQDTDLTLQIIGLQDTGVQYTVNGGKNTGAINLPANSSKTFNVGMLDSNIEEKEIGKSYDYTLRVNCSVSIGCY